MTKTSKVSLSLLLAVLIALLLVEQPRPSYRDAPLVTVVIESALTGRAERQALVSVEKALLESGAFEYVGGPNGACYLLPGTALPRSLGQLSDKEWSSVRTRYSSDYWLQARLFDFSRSLALIRCVPKEHRGQEARRALSRIKGEYGASFSAIYTDSKVVDLRLEPDYSKLQESFGAQALSLRIHGEKGEFFKVDRLRLAKAVAARLRAHKDIRGVSGPWEALNYAATARGLEVFEKSSVQTCLASLLSLPFPHEAPCLSRDGSKVSFVVSIAVEGEQARALCSWIRVQLLELARDLPILGLPKASD